MQHKPLHYTRFEFIQILNSGIFIGLISVLFMWRFVSMNLAQWVTNFLGLFIITELSLFIFTGGAKFLAFRRGCFLSYKRWKSGQIFGLVISVLSTGIIPLLFVGTLDIEANLRVRHGKIFPHESSYDILHISFGSVLLLLVFGGLLALLPGQFFNWAQYVPLLMSLFILIPFPFNQGAQMYYASPKKYIPLALVLALICLLFMFEILFLLPVLIVFFLFLLALRVKRH